MDLDNLLVEPAASEPTTKFFSVDVNDLVNRQRFQDDEEFFTFLDKLPCPCPEGPWLAGGSVRRILMGDRQDSDYDFFFSSPKQLKDFVEEIVKGGGVLVRENDFNKTFLIHGKKVQAIHHRFYSTLGHVLDSFDFTICQFGYDGHRLLIGVVSPFDAATKHLVPTTITYAVSSVRRIVKYTKQGFYICSGGIASLLSQVASNPELIHAEMEYLD